MLSLTLALTALCSIALLRGTRNEFTTPTGGALVAAPVVLAQPCRRPVR